MTRSVGALARVKDSVEKVSWLVLGDNPRGANENDPLCYSAVA